MFVEAEQVLDWPPVPTTPAQGVVGTKEPTGKGNKSWAVSLTLNESVSAGASWWTCSSIWPVLSEICPLVLLLLIKTAFHFCTCSRRWSNASQPPPRSVWNQLWPKTNSGNVSFKSAKWTKKGLQSCLLFLKWVSEPSGCSPAFLNVPFLSWIHQTSAVTPEPGNYSCCCLLGCVRRPEPGGSIRVTWAHASWWTGGGVRGPELRKWDAIQREGAKIWFGWRHRNKRSRREGGNMVWRMWYLWCQHRGLATHCWDLRWGWNYCRMESKMSTGQQNVPKAKSKSIDIM